MHGFKNWFLTEEPKQIPKSVIHIDLPPGHQQKLFTCGGACLRAICKYFKVSDDTEQEYIEKLHSSQEGGTTPDNLIKVAKAYGLTVVAQKKMKLIELKKLIASGIPVICAMQAWGKNYDQEDSGHYVVAIGFDDEKIYFMDPAMKGARGWLSCDDFIERWHDKDAKGERYIQFGIAMYKSGEKETHELLKTKKIN